jgi:Ca2+-binding RTX toxin-like protein
MRTRFALIAGLSASLSLFGLGSPAGAGVPTVSCSVSGTMLTVNITSSLQPTIQRQAGGEIEVIDYFEGKQTCTGGTPTVTTIDLIDVNVTNPGSSPQIKISFENGPFAPGTVTEMAGSSEIEWDFSYAGASIVDGLLLIGGSGADYWTFGAGGINLNADETPDDSDVTAPNLELVEAHGGGGNDAIKAGGGEGTGLASGLRMTIFGDDGSDNLQGGTQPDDIITPEGTGQAANDQVDGGAGNRDYVSYGNVSSDLNLNLAAGTVTGAGNDSLSLIENVEAGEGDDVVRGTPNPNFLDGRGGNDTMPSGTEGDSLNGGVGIDTLEIQEGPSKVNFENGTSSGPDGDYNAFGFENVDGSPQRDVVTGNNLNNVFNAGGGNDVFNGKNLRDTFNAGGGDDTMQGSNGIEIANGGPGADVLRGGNDNDKLSGSTGNDKLFGDAGNDTLNGGPQNDQCTGGPGQDALMACEN